MSLLLICWTSVGGRGGRGRGLREEWIRVNSGNGKQLIQFSYKLQGNWNCFAKKYLQGSFYPPTEGSHLCDGASLMQNICEESTWVLSVLMTSSWQACPQGEEPSGQILLQRHESLWNDPGNNPSPVRVQQRSHPSDERPGEIRRSRWVLHFNWD